MQSFSRWLPSPDFGEADAALNYELAVIAFESVQGRMKLALGIGDVELIDEIQPELAAAAEAARAARVPANILN